MESCIFCRIGAGEIPARVVHEDADCMAFRDLDPKAPLHVLVIPKRHIGSVNEMTAGDEALVGHLVAVAKAVAQAESVGESGYRLVLNAGPDAGQSVAHLHLHLLGGRALDWPPG